jgi:hypothetical protein
MPSGEMVWFYSEWKTCQPCSVSRSAHIPSARRPRSINPWVSSSSSELVTRIPPKCALTSLLIAPSPCGSISPMARRIAISGERGLSFLPPKSPTKNASLLPPGPPARGRDLTATTGFADSADHAARLARSATSRTAPLALTGWAYGHQRRLSYVNRCEQCGRSALVSPFLPTGAGFMPGARRTARRSCRRGRPGCVTAGAADS